ncbi:putative leucine-rich repeat domain superfamily [Helianthus annuus]|nr:putative leucine-rich repeat domain superfamily [Helianthus annuus]
MKELLSTPNFDGLPRFHKLELNNCGKLKSIHTSLGNHTSLQDVRVISCDKLKMFPTIVHMENLNTLEISNCPKILEFPEIQANIESLLNLSLERIGIEVLPSSIGERCTNLISLDLSNLNNLKSIEFNFDAFKDLEKLKLEVLRHPVKIRRQLFPQWLYVLRKLDLGACHFKDVEIPNGIVELSNLQELGLRGDDFSPIEFSLVHFTQLKALDLSFCRNLLELPELPSSLTILNAMHCESLTTFGDCYKNCTGLCQVLVVGTSIINDNGKLLEYMLEVCTAIENRPMFLQLEGAEVAKGVMPCLYGGRRCRLQLPENWCKDFAGFLMCVVFTKATGNCLYNFVDISMKQVMSDMDSKDDVVWEKCDSDRMTWVWYVPFNSLTHTTWWDQTYKALEFHIEKYYDFQEQYYSGFGVRLVDRKSRSGLTETSTDSSTNYIPHLTIHIDSESDLRMSLRARRFTK